MVDYYTMQYNLLLRIIRCTKLLLLLPFNCAARFELRFRPFRSIARQGSPPTQQKFKVHLWHRQGAIGVHVPIEHKIHVSESCHQNWEIPWADRTDKELSRVVLSAMDTKRGSYSSHYTEMKKSLMQESIWPPAMCVHLVNSTLHNCGTN